MSDLSQKTLALFFTNGVSLETWGNNGNLEREVKRYSGFAKHFKNIIFFTYGNSSDLDFKKHFPVNLKIFPKKHNLPFKLYSFLLPFFYRKEIKKVDIIKTNQMNGSWSAVIAKKLYGKKLVVRCGLEWLRFSKFKKRSPFIMPFIYLAESIAYRNADIIILPSEEDKNFVIDTFKIEESKIKIIPNHIDTSFFKPLTVTKEKNRIITVARLEEQKNLEALILAVSSLPVKLIILGDGSLRQKLESLAKEKGADVEFKGNVNQKELPLELSKSQLFVISSFYEGSPKSLLEAMAMGLPCIGTNVAGINNILVDKKNGYLCNPDASSIKSAIEDLIGNQELQKTIGDNALITIKRNFSFEKIYSDELMILNSL